MVSTTSLVSTTSVVAGALVAGSVAGADSSTVATTMVVEVAAIKASISNGVGDDVVGAGPIVWTTSVLGDGGKAASELGGGLGGSSVLSVPSVSPPVVSTIPRIAARTNAAAPATQMTDRDSFHHVPAGST